MDSTEISQIGAFDNSVIFSVADSDVVGRSSSCPAAFQIPQIDPSFKTTVSMLYLAFVLRSSVEVFYDTNAMSCCTVVKRIKIPPEM
jgi:hypothetical protein